MAEPKYTVKPPFQGADPGTMHTIIAAKEFLTQSGHQIVKGTIGGKIRAEENLSHSGACWIFPGVEVIHPDVYIREDAEIMGKVSIDGNTTIYGNARISGDKMDDGITINGSGLRAEGTNGVRIAEDAYVHGNVQVLDHAKIYGNAMVSGYVIVENNARVFGNCSVISGGFLPYTNEPDTSVVGMLDHVDGDRVFRITTSNFDFIEEGVCQNDILLLRGIGQTEWSIARRIQFVANDWLGLLINIQDVVGTAYQFCIRRQTWASNITTSPTSGPIKATDLEIDPIMPTDNFGNHNTPVRQKFTIPGLPATFVGPRIGSLILSKLLPIDSADPGFANLDLFPNNYIWTEENFVTEVYVTKEAGKTYGESTAPDMAKNDIGILSGDPTESSITSSEGQELYITFLADKVPLESSARTTIRIYDNAQVGGSATVRGFAHIGGDAVVSGTGKVLDGATVGGLRTPTKNGGRVLDDGVARGTVHVGTGGTLLHADADSGTITDNSKVPCNYAHVRM